MDQRNPRDERHRAPPPDRGRRGDGPFRNFQSVYFEAYDAVKRSSPHTLVFYTVKVGVKGAGKLTELRNSMKAGLSLTSSVRVTASFVAASSIWKAS